jgi:predicted transcriptional regulator
MTETVLTLRIDVATMGRLERIAEAMTKAAQGAKVKRGTAARAVLERGLDVTEASLGITKKKR